MNNELISLYIYLTDECNLKCIHCWQSAPLVGNGKFSHLKFEDCKTFLDDSVAIGLKNITFSGGEPLLNHEFQKFAEYFYKKSINMTIETNGMAISNNDILKTIKNTRIYCAISVDGVTPDTHNKQRGIKDAFERTIESIDLLEKERINYQIIMAISKFNYRELIPLLDWIKETKQYCSDFKINIVKASGRAIGMDKKGILFKPEEYPQITSEIANIIEKYPFNIMLHIDPVFYSFKNLIKKYSCGGHCGYQSSLSILANGNISICSLGKQFDKYIFGHVNTINLKDVWENNTLLANIHDQTHTKLKGVCANCIFRSQCFGGCRAEALCTYGDIFAPNPRCQQYYESGKFPKSRLICHI